MKPLLLSALLASSLTAAPRWLRTTSSLAVCAAQTLDLVSTYGKRELNPFLAGPNQSPRWGAMISIKAGVCAASIVWTVKTKSDAVVPLNLGIAGVTSGVAVKNWRIKQ